MTETAVPVPPCSPEEVTAAVAFVEAGATLALSGFRGDALDTEWKGDGTPVTHFDKAVERQLREAILGLYPDDGILGEEEDDLDGSSGRLWVIDPIDGTDPYSRGIVTWGTLVACNDEHGPLLSIVCCPWANETVVAGRGLGTTLNGVRATVSDRTELNGAVVATSGIEWWPAGALDAVHAAGVKVKTWGNAYALAIAATGRVDAFFDAQVKPWDLGPAPLIATEAGGVFGDLDGNPHIYGGSGIIASPALFEPLRALLQGSGGSAAFHR